MRERESNRERVGQGTHDQFHYIVIQLLQPIRELSPITRDQRRFSCEIPAHAEGGLT
jgi:hypothetical protein